MDQFGNRSSAVNVLQQIQKEGSINNMCVLSLLQNSQPEHKPLAASLLLQLSMLVSLRVYFQFEIFRK